MDAAEVLARGVEYALHVDAGCCVRHARYPGHGVCNVPGERLVAVDAEHASTGLSQCMNGLRADTLAGAEHYKTATVES
jgi:hypothetical protein